MTNRCLLGAGVALAVALGGVQAHAQLFPYGAPGVWYIGPEGGWTSLTSQSDSTSPVLVHRAQRGRPLPLRGLMRRRVPTAASMSAPAAATSGARGVSRKNTATGVTSCPTATRSPFSARSATVLPPMAGVLRVRFIPTRS